MQSGSSSLPPLSLSTHGKPVSIDGGKKYMVDVHACEALRTLVECLTLVRPSAKHQFAYIAALAIQRHFHPELPRLLDEQWASLKNQGFLKSLREFTRSFGPFLVPARSATPPSARRGSNRPPGIPLHPQINPRGRSGSQSARETVQQLKADLEKARQAEEERAEELKTAQARIQELKGENEELRDDVQRLSEELARAKVKVSNPAKYGEGLLERQQKATLDSAREHPRLPMSALLEKLELMQPQKYFICPHCKNFTSDLGQHYEDHEHSVVCPECELGEGQPLPNLWDHFRHSHRGRRSSVAGPPTERRAARRQDRVAFLAWLRRFGFDTEDHPTARDVERRVRDFADDFMVNYQKRGALSPEAQTELGRGLMWDHVAAVYMYTLETELYSSLNGALRGRNAAELQQYKDLILHLDAGLRALPPVETLGQPLYRGMNARVDPGLYREGECLVWPSFSSTTRDPRVAQEFLLGAKDAARAQGTMFMLMPLSGGRSRGRAISRLSALSKEQEVLYQFNTWFRVSQKLGPAAKKFLEFQLNRSLEAVEVYELLEITEEDAQDLNQSMLLQASLNNEALRNAIRRANLPAVNLLLSQMSDVRAKDKDGKTLLMHAAEKGLAEVCIELLKLNSDVNAADKYGRTPLMFAAEKSLTEVCERMLELRADVTARDHYDQTAVMYAAEKRLGLLCIEMLEVKADVNARDKNQKTLLMYAASNGLNEVCLTLVETMADPNARNSQGKTPTMFAAERGLVEVLQKLVEKGADLNARNRDGETALMYGAIYRHSEICTTLLELRADPNISDEQGRTAVMFAAEKILPEVCIRLLEAGAEPNSRDRSGETPLMVA
eukprot:RCo017662